MENVGGMAWKAFNTVAAGAGIALGATALGVKANASHFRQNGCNNGCWGSYNDGCGCGHGDYGYFNGGIYGGFNCGSSLVNRYELGQTQTIANLVSKDYSNQSDLGLFADYTTRFKDMEAKNSEKFEVIFKELVASRERQQAEICQLDKEIALNKQATEYNFGIQGSQIAALNERLNGITKTIIPIDVICPEPLAACAKVTVNPQVLTSTAATTTGTVVNGTVDVK